MNLQSQDNIKREYVSDESNVVIDALILFAWFHTLIKSNDMVWLDWLLLIIINAIGIYLENIDLVVNKLVTKEKSGTNILLLVR